MRRRSHVTDDFGKRLKAARKKQSLYLNDIPNHLGLIAEYFAQLEIGSVTPSAAEREELEKFIQGKPFDVARLQQSTTPPVPPRQKITPEMMSEYTPRFQNVLKLLDEKRDRELYKSLIDFRSHPTEPHRFLSYSRRPHDAYFEFLLPKKIKTVIEGGVAEGFFTRKYLSFATMVYGFEPYIEVLKKSPYYKAMDSKQVAFLPYALWSCRTKLNFFKNVDDSHCSQLCFDGRGEEIETISIDAFSRQKNISVDLIKLDIEGAEIEALKGAEQTILRDKPHLTISIYHEPHHLFEIPLWLHERLPNHRFKLGHYSNGCTETILYCIP